MSKLTIEEAKESLYSLWENGQIPSNFTEDHSEYERALQQMIEFGKIDFSEFF